MNDTEFLWTEKYRPKTVADCILPDDLKATFQKIVDSGEMQNLLLAGTSGLGKTTVALAMTNELKLDSLLINASMESGIDTLRNKIQQFASSVSLMNAGPKVVILDEADYLNPQSTQPALRGFIEAFSDNCRFVMTCNFKNRIIEPLHSRCSIIEFNTTKKVLAVMAGKFMIRLQDILKKEKVTYEPKVLAELIIRYAPDWRRVIGECQRYSVAGKIDSGILVNLSDESMSGLMKALKEKDFKTVRSWVVNNMDLEPTAIFRKIYDNMIEYAKPTSVPQIVLILADYQYKQAFVADQEINMVACMTELMASVEWK